jgi:hypothetical protein
MGGLLGNVREVERRSGEARVDVRRRGVDARHGLASASEDDGAVDDLVGLEMDTRAALDAEQALASLAEVNDAPRGVRGSGRGIHEKLRGLRGSVGVVAAVHSSHAQTAGSSLGSKMRIAGWTSAHVSATSRAITNTVNRRKKVESFMGDLEGDGVELRTDLGRHVAGA